MRLRAIVTGALLLSATAIPALAQDRARPESQVPRAYVARGSSQEADLAKLQTAIGKLAGVLKVQIRPDAGGAVVIIDGDGSSTQSLLAAAAASVGYRLRPAPTRYYLATGPSGEADVDRLRKALRDTPGVEQVAATGRADGAAVRVSGAGPSSALATAGKAAGFTLQPLAAYVASGSSEAADLALLRKALVSAGIERVEMHGLIGGATLLAYGDTDDDRMAAAGKVAGYIVWPLSAAEGRREFQIQGRPSAAEREKLITALKELESIGEIEVRPGTDGDRLFVTGGRVRPPAVVAAASRAGVPLALVDIVTLPSLVPEAGRGTPPDYENRVLQEQAQLDAPAPPFSLLAQDGKTVFNLAEHAGKRPVVLLFGSCT
jgi:hypothetical protein